MLKKNDRVEFGGETYVIAAKDEEKKCGYETV